VALSSVQAGIAASIAAKTRTGLPPIDEVCGCCAGGATLTGRAQPVLGSLQRTSAAVKTTPPRIFLGFQETAGYYGNLKRGLDALGVPCVFVCLQNRYAHALEGNPGWANHVNGLAQRVARVCKRSVPTRVLWSALFRHVIGLPVLLAALPHYDAFVFCSFSTAFYFLDLPLLKLCGKKIIYVFHGSDTRPVYLNGFHLPRLDATSVALGLVRAQLQKLGVTLVERFADHIVSIPPQAHFHTRPLVSHYFVGIPCDPRQSEADSTVLEPSDRVRILHAPTQPGPKGSALIRRAVAAVKAKGHPVDLIEITGRPHHEVVEELRRCAFVVDQAYSDTPMAGFATEAAFFGKPAVVGGYYSATLANDLRPEETPPTLYCLPEQLEAAIERMTVDRAFREDLGRRAQAFVKREWSAQKVAERFVALASGDAPERWLFDPSAIVYVEGAGLSRDEARARIHAYLRAGGQSGLCVSDKPALLAELVAAGTAEAVAGLSQAP
jgi:glycosyltransferase involved in cell wall biosynthesis